MQTNKDYTEGKLPELIDIIIESGAALFVSAVGVPPRWAVDKLHEAGIAVMNMIGAPKHVKYALDSGADIICAQGGEGGGHTGDVATSLLIPKVVDLCKGHKAPLTGGPVMVIAAGGIYDGRGVCLKLSVLLCFLLLNFVTFSWPCRWRWVRRACGWALASSAPPRPERRRTISRQC